jgi:CRP/FNR family transcriptional regulator, cyclic AMP receptor protein
VADGFLERLTDEARAALEFVSQRREYPVGQVLFSEGDEGREVFVILDGQVKVVASAASGRDVILDVLDADSLLGELSAVDGEPRSAAAVALTPVTVLVVATDRFLAFLEEHGTAATVILQIVVARLRNTSLRQLQFGTSDALGRLCACLLTLHDRFGGNGEKADHVTIPLAQHEIAAMTGLSREAVVKALRALRSLGWIDMRARDLTILDEEAMRARAAG